MKTLKKYIKMQNYNNNKMTWELLLAYISGVMYIT